jgi:DNA repair protein RadC
MLSKAGHPDKATPGEKMNDSDAKIVEQALEIIARSLRQPGAVLSSPQAVKSYLTLHLARQEREVFGVLWLNVANAVIEHEDLFFGTLTHASVYPREVIKAALHHNAASLICFHCHPSSGRSDPSEADKLLTKALVTALALVDVRMLDHIIVGGMTTYSFAENGLL